MFSEPLLHTWMRLGDLEVAPVLKDLTFSKSIYMPDEACGELDATIVLTLLELSPVCVYEWHRPGEWVVIANLMQFGLARETLPPDTEVTVAVPPSKRMAKQLLRYETEHATLLQQVLLSKNTDRAIEQSRLLRRANGKPFSLRLREENLAITRRRISSRDDAQEV